MNRRQEPLADLNTRKLAMLTLLALTALFGCKERTATDGSIENSAQPKDRNIIAEPAIEDLSRFGRSIAAKLTSQKIEFVGVKNGLDPASVGSNEESGWSIFFLSFTAQQPSDFQMTGSSSTQTLSPEDKIRHERWQAQICTHELAEIMSDRNIDVVYATFGKADMPVSQCQNMN